MAPHWLNREIERLAQTQRWIATKLRERALCLGSLPIFAFTLCLVPSGPRLRSRWRLVYDHSDEN